MGTVWRADDHRLRREVAVKEVDLPASLRDDERTALQARAMREARAAARLGHASAVTVYDVVLEEGRAYIVMELVDSPTLDEVVRSRGGLSVERAAEIGLAVLAALESAHAAGIVHRDVKPSNIMVGPDGTVKLADFGIASVKDDPRITTTGLVLGSPSYMAPEQAEGLGSGPEADLWALGAALYFAVEGEPPFDRGQALPTLHAVLSDEPRTPRRAGALEPVVLSLLAKDPAARPGPPELRRMLESLAAGTGLEQPATTESLEPVEASAPASAPIRAAAPGAAPHEVEPESRTRYRLVVVGIVALLALIAVLGAVALLGGDNGTDRAARDRSDRRQDGGQGVPPQADEAVQSSIPEGWTQYSNPDTGYAVAYPQGWSIEEGGGTPQSVDFEDPESATFVRVDYQQPPGPDAVQAWEELESSFRQQHAGYRRVADIEPTTYKGYEAATWEFTFVEGDATVHALDLGFIVGDEYGFALYFSSLEEDWEASQDEFATFKQTFAPPP
jgi:hypothetical protein